MALQLHINVSLSRPPDRTWRRPPGRPRNKWLDQLRNDSTRPTGELWRRAVDRGHHHHHFICLIIQQYAHLHRYNFKTAGQQGPTRTLTAALKHVIKQLLGTYSISPLSMAAAAAADTVVQRRDGPRRLRDNDDVDDE